MPEDWTLDGAGVATFVQRLPTILEKMLGPGVPKPRTIFTDRGTGMYAPGGTIVGLYERAVHEAGFRVYWGADARQQSPDMGDVLLHETAVAFFRKRMREERPVVSPWEETLQQCYAAREELFFKHVPAMDSTNEHGLSIKYSLLLACTRNLGCIRLGISPSYREHPTAPPRVARDLLFSVASDLTRITSINTITFGWYGPSVSFRLWYISITDATSAWLGQGCCPTRRFTAF